MHTLLLTVYDHMKTIVEDQSVKIKPVNISDMKFEGKLPNLMTI